MSSGSSNVPSNTQLEPTARSMTDGGAPRLSCGR
jgi:hypothetical protein